MVIDSSDIQTNKLVPKNEFEKQVLNFFEDWLSESQFMQVKTSGSTGTPKLLDVEKSKMKHSATMTCDFLHLKQGDTALLCLPVEYISGKMLLVRTIIRKMEVIITEPSLKPLEKLNVRIDFCAMTPLQVENSLDKLHLIRKLIIGGASVSESLKLKLQNINSDIYETYGMSETLSHIALKKIRPQSEDYFTCFDGIEISKDERGCLKIYAPGLSKDILQTNDLIEITRNNQFRFLGRIDNVINSGGVKIFPEELEKLVKKQIPNEVVFVGIDDEKLGQKLALIIEGKESTALTHQLSTINYQLKLHHPKETIYIDEIPRTENGKVNRIVLKELLTQKQ